MKRGSKRAELTSRFLPFSRCAHLKIWRIVKPSILIYIYRVRFYTHVVRAIGFILKVSSFPPFDQNFFVALKGPEPEFRAKSWQNLGTASRIPLFYSF